MDEKRKVMEMLRPNSIDIISTPEVGTGNNSSLRLPAANEIKEMDEVDEEKD